ncbi:MAG TPA: methyltransferase domain-containing protein [Thermoanaerobaculia bacterium]|jgi:O-antigen chain-terminating methyltransferase
MATSGDDLERELAEEIRSAIRRLAPEAPDASDDGSPPDPVRLAEAHLTPSVPEGARLAGVKKGVLRALRLVWRDQAAFNALTLEAFRRARQEWEGRFASFRDATERALSEARRRAAVQDARFAELESSPRGPGVSPVPSAPSVASSSLPPAVYSLFEERFRGDPKAIAEGQRFYVDFLRGAPGPVLDAGCGRGEFLGLLREEGIAARGVESNPVSVRLCRDAGLDVEPGDAPAFLAAARPGSLGAVVAFQVVEHWPAAQIFAFLAAARRALAPGGTLVAETVNTDSLSALRAFFLDPTHVRPVPPAALAFLAEAAGFVDARIEFRSPLPPEERLSERSENDARLNRLLFGPQDYAVIARVPGP